MPQVPVVDYAVPRNPAVPSPSFGDVMSSSPLERDTEGLPAFVRVHVYRGAEIPPRQASLLDSGPLVSFERGLFFLATTGHAGWRDALQDIGRLSVRMAADLALDIKLPVEGVIAKALRQTVAEEFFSQMRGQDPQEARRQELERRLSGGHTFVLPYVDIVRTHSERVRSGLRKLDCTVVTLDTGTGEAQILCVKGVGAHFAGLCVQRRFEQELLLVTRGVWDELLGKQEMWEALARRYPDLSAVAVGRIWDDWKNAVQARIASRSLTQTQVASTALQRLGPWLDHYRRIPSTLESVRAAEALARGAIPAHP